VKNPRQTSENLDPACVVLVCEGPADQRTACAIADRVAVETIGWLETELLDSLRHWCGIDEDTCFVTWAGIKREAEKHLLRVHGHFRGERGALDAYAGRRALTLIAMVVPQVALVMLIRDSDGEGQRCVGLQQARDYREWSFSVLIGVAHCKREAWLLSCFEAAGSTESRRHRSLRKQLGFDPCAESHELTATEPTAKRNAKRVLDKLTDSDTERAERGVRETPIATMRSRGALNGLADFIGEIEEHFVPLFAMRRGR